MDHAGTMLGIYGAYVGPMLIHVVLLDAMLGPYSCLVELMLRQERRVPSNDSGFEGVMPSVCIFVCELTSQSEKSMELDISLKRLEIRG